MKPIKKKISDLEEGLIKEIGDMANLGSLYSERIKKATEEFDAELKADTEYILISISNGHIALEDTKEIGAVLNMTTNLRSPRMFIYALETLANQLKESYNLESVSLDTSLSAMIPLQSNFQ